MKSLRDKKIDQVPITNEINKTFIDSLAIGIVVQDVKGEIIEWNSAAEKILGLTIDQMMGRSSLDSRWRAIHEDGSDFPGHSHPAMQTLQTGKELTNIIMGIEKPDGTLTWISINSHPLFDVDQKVSLCIASFTDITDYKRVLDLVAESETRKQTILSSTNESFFLLDAHYNLIELNNSAKILVTYLFRKEAILGTNIIELTESHHQEIVKASLDRAIKGETVTYDVKLPASGVVKWINLTYKPTHQLNRISGVCVTIVDITIRKTAEELARTQEQQMRSLAENVPGAVYEYQFNPDGTHGFTYLSPRIERMFGIEAKTFASSFNHVHPEDIDKLVACLNHARTSKEVFSFEGRLITPTGDTRWHCASSSFSYETVEGAFVFTGIITDTTERKILEEEKIKRQKELQQKALEDERLKKKGVVKAALQAQERERNHISVELHENFIQVLSSCKLMLTSISQTDEKDKTLLNNVLVNIDTVIDEARDISNQLNTSTIAFFGLPHALNDLVQRVSVLAKTKIGLHTSAYDDSIEVNPEILLAAYRIIQEQVNNVIKHANAEKAEIRLSLNESNLQITITDDGNGFRVDTTEKGLGFINIDSRTEQFNGEFKIISNPGDGCQLKCTIPLQA